MEELKLLQELGVKCVDNKTLKNNSFIEYYDSEKKPVPEYVEEDTFYDTLKDLKLTAYAVYKYAKSEEHRKEAEKYGGVVSLISIDRNIGFKTYKDYLEGLKILLRKERYFDDIINKAIS